MLPLWASLQPECLMPFLFKLPHCTILWDTNCRKNLFRFDLYDSDLPLISASPLAALQASGYWFVMLITRWGNGKSGWEVKRWKWKPNQLCHSKEAGTEVGWMLRGEMTYHEKTEIEAKSDFHVAIAMYDVMKWMMYMKCIYWHNLYIGFERSVEVTVVWQEENDVTCAYCNACYCDSPRRWGLKPKEYKHGQYRGGQNQVKDPSFSLKGAFMWFWKPCKMCACLAQEKSVKPSNNNCFPLQTDNDFICMAVAAPSPSVTEIPWATEKAECPSVMWCMTRHSYSSARMQISKKQLKFSYMFCSSLQPEQFEKGLCAQQLLLATSTHRYPASLQEPLVLHKAGRFRRRSSELASAAQGRWWKAGKEELLGDPGSMTEEQIRREDVHVCPP